MTSKTLPKLTYATCRNCNRPAIEVGVLSHTRLCTPCAVALEEANNLQISEGVGPFAEHRLRRTVMAAHRKLVAMIETGA